MISYRGNGVFLCIRIGRYDVLPDTFEMILNRQIYATKPGTLAKTSLKVCIGDTTVLHSASKAGALDALSQAIASADEKAERANMTLEISRRVLSNQTRSAEEERIERRVYSTMLKDLMREGGPKRSAFGRQSR